MPNGIEINFNKTVLVQRLVEIAGTDTEEYDTHIAELACHIQPLDDQWGEDEVGSMGKDHLMFCDQADIKENDRIVDGDRHFRVTGIEDFENFLGQAKHLEIRIRRFIP